MSGACAQKSECNKQYCCEAASRGMPCQCPRGGESRACPSMGGNCPSGGNACPSGMGGKCDEPPEAMIMGMANHAWKELMIEKMKQAYEKKSGKQMDKIAEVGVEYCIRFWSAKMEHKKMKMKGCEAKMQQMDEYSDKLMEAFMSK